MLMIHQFLYESVMPTIATFPAPALLGSFKTLGAFGPAYQVVEPVRPLADGDWFPSSVRDIRAFRIEQWSDFTPVVKGGV